MLIVGMYVMEVIIIMICVVVLFVVFNFICMVWNRVNLMRFIVGSSFMGMFSVSVCNNFF